jgi:hypothetical protein
MHGGVFKLPLQFASDLGNLLKSPWKFKPCGRSGLPVSELFPNVGAMIDEICLIRSMVSEQVDHGGAILQLHTGSAVFPRPSMGAWVLYGLGTENQNLPGFIVLGPATIHGAAQNYGSAFLPASFQGTPIGDANTPMRQARLKNLARAEPALQLERLQLDFIQAANRRHRRSAGDDLRLDVRASNHSSWPSACRWKRPRPSIWSASRNPSSTSMASDNKG